MKTEILTKTKDTKNKFRVFVILSLFFIVLTLGYWVNVIDNVIFKWGAILYLIILLIITWTKNYKINGHISLGEQSIKVFVKDDLVKEFNYEECKIDYITINWSRYFNGFVQIFNGFLYLDICNTSIEISYNSKIYSYDIDLDRVGRERKNIDLIFSRLEEKGIKTSFNYKW